MCLAVYIASDRELPLVDWNEQAPKFYVGELSGEEKRVAKQFSLTHVAYAGSHQGCGCGFFKEGEEGDELIQVQSNYNALSYYLLSLKLKGAKLAIFSCWGGDQTVVPEYKAQISLEQLMSPEFEFKEKAYYVIA